MSLVQVGVTPENVLDYGAQGSGLHISAGISELRFARCRGP